MVNKKKCIGCATCVQMCPVGAISINDEGFAQIDESICIKCGTCEAVCPVNAIEIKR